MLENICSDKSTKTISKFNLALLLIYFSYCFFEPYINGAIGPMLKYYIVLLCTVFAFSLRRINTRSLFLAGWFGFKCLSIVWGYFNSGGIYGSEISLHLLTQVAMILLIAFSATFKFTANDIQKLVYTQLIFSAVLGILALFFSNAYLTSFTARQTLTIFGIQNDPNDTAAFFLIAIGIAGYNLFIRKEKLILNTVIIVINSFTVFMTGSRGGLLTFALIVLVLVLAVCSKQRKSAKAIIGSILAFGIICVAVYYLAKNFLPTNIYVRLFVDGYGDGSGRIERWQHALKLFSESPIWGKGWGGYYVGTHNTFLTMLCDVGIIGALIFIIPIFKIVIRNIKRGEWLPCLVIVAGFMPAVFIEAINKRFFWNAILIAILLDKFYSTPKRAKERDSVGLDRNAEHRHEIDKGERV